MLAHELACFERRLAGQHVELRTHNAVAETAQRAWLDDLDGMMIGGSGNFSVHHPDSQAWVGPLRHVLESALERRLPGFGVCFGHQLLGMHLGATVRTSDAHEELGTHGFQLTEAGRRCKLFGSLSPSFQAHTGHTDCVTEVPSGVELLASNERLETQAFKVRGAPFYTTQFHPDLVADEARERYLSSKARPDPASRARARSFRRIAEKVGGLLGSFVASLDAGASDK